MAHNVNLIVLGVPKNNNYKKEHLKMQFQFPEVSSIQEQIKILTEQLQQLTDKVAPYAECESAASELVAKVSEHRQVMSDKGLAQESLNSWAIALHEAGCGSKPEQGDILASNGKLNSMEMRMKQAISEKDKLATQLRFFKDSTRENDCLSSEVLKLREENEDYQKRYDGMKAQMEQAILERERIAKAAKDPDADLKIQVLTEELIKSREENERLKRKNYELEQLSDALDEQLSSLDHEEEEIVIQVLPDLPLEIAEKEIVDVTAIATDDQAVVQETIEVAEPPENKCEMFLSKISRSTVFWNNLTWQQVTEILGKEKGVFKKLGLTRATKVQSERRDVLFGKKFAELLACYIAETGDVTDFEWVPAMLKEKAEALLLKRAEVAETFFKRGDLIKVEGDDELWTVISYDSDTEWVTAFKGNTQNSFHHLEVVLKTQQPGALTAIAS